MKKALTSGWAPGEWGIFAIQRAARPAERIQVGLLNVLEERDVQIRGHRVRPSLDIIARRHGQSRGYTNRGSDHHALKPVLRPTGPTTPSTEAEVAVMRAEAGSPDRWDFR